MKISNEVKVGLVVFFALLILIFMYAFLGRLRLQGKTYKIYGYFTDARNLNKGSNIRVAGVQVGKVNDLSLTKRGKAQVEMLIWAENFIPDDSVASATTGGLIGDTYVEIVPGRSNISFKNGQTIKTEQVVTYDQLVGNINGVLMELKTTARGINSVVGDDDLKKRVKDTIMSLQQTIKKSEVMVTSINGMLNESAPEARRLLANLNIATQNAVAMTKNLDSVLMNDTRPQLKAILADARLASANLNSAITDARPMIDSFKESAKKIDTALTKVNTVADQAESMMTKLNDASSGLKELATDPILKENIKKTLANTAEASDQAKQLLTGLNKKFGLKDESKSPAKKTEVPVKSGAQVNALLDTTHGKYRADAEYLYRANNKDFYRLGAMDIGENATVNLQAGMILDQNDLLRYGLYASRLGLGYDRKVGRLGTLSVDLYRPNDLMVDFRGTWDISKTFGFFGGITDAFNADRRAILVGVQYKK